LDLGGVKRMVVAALFLLMGLVFGPAAAEVVPDLYKGQTIVTGRDNLEERRRGIREVLPQVLVKVSGDDRLAVHPRLASLLERAESFVAGLAYEDRKKGVQISDEQGTRDRSYVLSVAFDPARIDAALGELGAGVWEADRPKLLVLLGIRDGVGTYVLGTNTERGYGHRETFFALRQRRGLPLALPRMEGIEQRMIEYLTLVSTPDPAALDAMRGRYQADATLVGTMAVTPAGLWDTKWTLLRQGRSAAWTVEGTTFDRAIEEGLGRSARIMAGLVD